MSSSPQQVADALAEAAVAEVTSGMIVGLGTGRTAARGILALAARVKEENLDVRCVPTSHACETIARSQGLHVIDFAVVESVDLLFDGADEVDRQLRMLKGKGGAMTRERIVAHAAKRRVYMIQESKIVDRLGLTSPLGIAVLPFGVAATRTHLRRLGLNGVLRPGFDGHLFLTDNGHVIMDVTLDDRDLDELACDLNAVPGVVDHGLFLTEADEVLVEGRGEVVRLTRPGPVAR